MNSSPLVSIIVPCRNAEPWLSAALESCLNQTYSNVEIIVVDDGSTDNSLEIAQSFTTQGVTVLNGPRRNAAAARNTGLQKATGNFLQFLDADDLLAPDKITQQMFRTETCAAGTVFTGCWSRFTNTLEGAYVYQENPLFSDLSPANYLRHYASTDCMMHPAAWLIPRSLMEAAGPWDEQLTLNDDGEYFARIVAVSSNVAYCSEALSYYRSSISSSLSGQRSRKHLESAYLALTLITEKMLALENSSIMRAAAADLYQRFAYDYYPDGYDLIDIAQTKANQLGGSTFAPLGGKTFQLAKKFLGWKLARRLQISANK